MTALMTRQRPLSAYSPRIVRPPRPPGGVQPAVSGFSAAEERLASRQEIDLLRAMYLMKKV